MLSLERYRVLDLSRTVPGPFASHVLADMGMEVIKVEEPTPRAGMGRDPLTPPTPSPEQEEFHAAYNGLARNKKSLALDLMDPQQRPRALEIFYRLVSRSDVAPSATPWLAPCPWAKTAGQSPTPSAWATSLALSMPRPPSWLPSCTAS